jgi:hypothetical protein
MIRNEFFSASVCGQAVKLEILGFNVTSDGEGCGTNKMKVYWAYGWSCRESPKGHERAFNVGELAFRNEAATKGLLRSLSEQLGR